MEMFEVESCVRGHHFSRAELRSRTSNSEDPYAVAVMRISAIVVLDTIRIENCVAP